MYSFGFNGEWQSSQSLVSARSCRVGCLFLVKLAVYWSTCVVVRGWFDGWLGCRLSQRGEELDTSCQTTTTAMAHGAMDFRGTHELAHFRRLRLDWDPEFSALFAVLVEAFERVRRKRCLAKISRAGELLASPRDGVVEKILRTVAAGGGWGVWGSDPASALTPGGRNHR